MSSLQSQCLSTRLNPSFFNPSLGRFAQTCLPAAFTAAVILFMFCGFARPVRAAVHEEWNRRWKDSFGAANKVAVDKAGNVFVAGYSYNGSNFDYRLVKYAPNGTELWSQRYDGPAHGDDKIVGLALDAAGDAYVTGSSIRNPKVYALDFATLKYASDGTLLWIRRYEGPQDIIDEATALAVDAAGNAYVTGLARTNSRLHPERVYSDTLKYAPDGRLLWETRYRDPVYFNGFYVSAIALDGDGNAYLTGTESNAEHDVCLTIKYSSDGVQHWANTFSYNKKARNQAYAIAVDGDGNVYIVGTSTGADPFANDYYLTIKYDTHGKRIWLSLLYHTQDINSEAAAVAVDAVGNVVVTGDDGTVKYSPDGTVRWVQNDQGKVFNSAVAVDVEGNAYVAGTALGVLVGGGYQNTNFSLIKYGADGSVHWSRFFQGPGLASNEVSALALDDANNVYITGTFTGNYTIGSGMRTVKYSQ